MSRSWTVDGPVRSGRTACAAISGIAVAADAMGSVLTGHGSKRPLLLVILRGDSVTILDPEGRRCPIEELERRFPGALDRITGASGD